MFGNDWLQGRRERRQTMTLRCWMQKAVDGRREGFPFTSLFLFFLSCFLKYFYPRRCGKEKAKRSRKLNYPPPRVLSVSPSNYPSLPILVFSSSLTVLSLHNNLFPGCSFTNNLISEFGEGKRRTPRHANYIYTERYFGTLFV